MKDSPGGQSTVSEHAIRSVEELREVLGSPGPRTEGKLFDSIDSHAKRFIEQSPLVMVATVDNQGHLEVSPKGDAPGFVVVEDQHTLLIPERKGNKLTYGFLNLLQTGRISLLFAIPGLRETLRVNGSATLTKDPELLDRLSAADRAGGPNKPALLATRVNVERSFVHCGKAMIRSDIWQPESWPQDFKFSLGQQLADKFGADEAMAKTIDDSLEDSYRNKLY